MIMKTVFLKIKMEIIFSKQVGNFMSFSVFYPKLKEWKWKYGIVIDECQIFPGHLVFKLVNPCLLVMDSFYHDLCVLLLFLPDPPATVTILTANMHYSCVISTSFLVSKWCNNDNFMVFLTDVYLIFFLYLHLHLCSFFLCNRH